MLVNIYVIWNHVEYRTKLKVNGEVEGNSVILGVLPALGVPAVVDIVNGMSKIPFNLPSKSAI